MFTKLKYEASFPFYGPTRPDKDGKFGYKLYAVHVFNLNKTLDGDLIKRYRILAIEDQPHYGFDTVEELEEFAFKTFDDLQMFQEWAKEFRHYGSMLSIWHKQNLKPFKF